MKPLIALGFVIGVFSAPAWGAVITMSASLDGQDARPPNLAPARGYATVMIDNATGEIDVTGTYRTASHVNAAEIRGRNSPPIDYLGPVVLTLTVSVESVDSGETGSFRGSGTLDPGQLSELLGGEYFISVDTITSLGQGPSIGGVIATPEPSTGFLSILLLFGASLRRRSGRNQSERRKHIASQF